MIQQIVSDIVSYAFRFGSDTENPVALALGAVLVVSGVCAVKSAFKLAMSLIIIGLVYVALNMFV